MTHVDRVPLLDLTRGGEACAAALRAAFERVYQSGCYILGPEVEALERECAELLGVEHAIGVSSGTDALLLALMTLGIGHGDEVICPTYTFFATAGSIWRTGARPVFVDCDARSFNCDPEDIAAKITEKTRAIVPVHLFGQCAEMAAILELAGEKGIAVIEDAAQAIGARHGGRSAGALGSFGCFSFYPSKNLACLGDGGLLVTSDATLARRARSLRVHGAEESYRHRSVGGNFRLDELQAAFLRVRLGGLEAAIQQRRRHAASYDRGIEAMGGGRILAPHRRGGEHTFNQYVIRLPGPGRRDALRRHLERHGIGTAIYYPVPLHLQECFAALGGKPGDHPVAERAAQETLALPVFPELTEAERDRVVQALTAFS